MYHTPPAESASLQVPFLSSSKLAQVEPTPFKPPTPYSIILFVILFHKVGLLPTFMNAPLLGKPARGSIFELILSIVVQAIDPASISRTPL